MSLGAGYAGDPDFDYSGDFECRLSSVGDHDTYSTLLTEDAHQNRDWESRGRFFSADRSGVLAPALRISVRIEFLISGHEVNSSIHCPGLYTDRSS